MNYKCKFIKILRFLFDSFFSFRSSRIRWAYRPNIGERENERAVDRRERVKVRVLEKERERERPGENLSKKREISFIETVSRFPIFEPCAGVFLCLHQIKYN